VSRSVTAVAKKHAVAEKPGKNMNLAQRQRDEKDVRASLEDVKTFKNI
jgi:hypothetical protein